MNIHSYSKNRNSSQQTVTLIPVIDLTFNHLELYSDNQYPEVPQVQSCYKVVQTNFTKNFLYSDLSIGPSNYKLHNILLMKKNYPLEEEKIQRKNPQECEILGDDENITQEKQLDIAYYSV